jgi:hypothetical protein
MSQRLMNTLLRKFTLVLVPRFEVMRETLILLCKLNSKRIKIACVHRVQLRMTCGFA